MRALILIINFSPSFWSCIPLRYLFASFLVLMLFVESKGQVGIGDQGESSPDPSAMLDLNSHTRGVLFPRLSEVRRNLIPSPATGLFIYNTTSNRFNYFNGNTWCEIESTYISNNSGFISPGGGVSIGTEPDLIPDSSSLLDIKDSTRGVLFPRTIIGAITLPTTGLMLFDISINRLVYFMGNHWVTPCIVSTGNSGVIGIQSSIGVAIKSETSLPHHSAILDINANNKGVLIPRLTSSQRDLMLPKKGLLIYNSTSNNIEYFDGNAWYAWMTDFPDSPSASSHQIGDTVITWKWNPVSSATGYKWNVLNDFSTAIELGTLTSTTETGLTCDSLYTRYIWAYNECGNSTATVINANTASCAFCDSVVLDLRDGKTYHGIQIGSQCWLKENLNIGLNINSAQEQKDNGSIEKYCYDNLEANCDIYGGLYSWGEMVQYLNEGSNYTSWNLASNVSVKGICPDGWHLPTDQDWCILSSYLDSTAECTALGLTGTHVGGKMKETGATHWATPNSGATNSSNFTALPGGRFLYNSTFQWINQYGYFSSSGEYSSSNAWYRRLCFDNEQIARNYESPKTSAISVRCIKNRVSGSDTIFITTHPIRLKDQNSVIAGGSVIDDGGNFITTRGVCWSATPNPLISNDTVQSGSGSVNFKITVDSLAPNMTYYFRAFAVSSAGTSYGNTVSCTTWSPCDNLPTVVDLRDGKIYNTIKIGTQCWLKENLNIGVTVTASQTPSNNNIIEKYCYGGLDSNCYKYGGLYRWDEMMQYMTVPGGKGICPDGWHIPTMDEWNLLINYLGGASMAGSSLKEIGTQHWSYPNINANNMSGYTALPSGFVNNVQYLDVSGKSYFWSSSKTDQYVANSIQLIFNQENVLYSGHDIRINGLSVRCLLGEGTMPTFPTVSTATPTTITQISVTTGGSVTNDGGAMVTAKGVCWSPYPDPLISGSHTIDGSALGSYTSLMQGLQPSTVYYFRAYATNVVGTAYGSQFTATTTSFTNPCPESPTVTDPRDGKIYSTILYGSQCWMAQNLNIGVMINVSQDQTNNQTIEKYCFNNLESNCDIYGGLYSWYELMQYSLSQGIQGVCPSGWHVPTDNEWCVLSQYIDPTVNCNITNYSGADIGLKMKTLNGWYQNNNVTNSSEFSVLPGGYATNHAFNSRLYLGQFWTSTERITGKAWTRGFQYNQANFYRQSNDEPVGFSVRCLRDSWPTVTTTQTTNVTQTSAKSGGNVVNDGGSLVSSRGVCWSISSNPTIQNNHTNDGSGSGIFTSTLPGLVSNTTYYVRAYATNSVGTSYGSQVVFTTLGSLGLPCPDTPTVPYEGQTYNTVQIGDQCWFKNNLNVGIKIPSTQNATNNQVIEKYCANDLESNCDIFGGLYNWNEAMQYVSTSGARGICPVGWHVPSNAEWTVMTTFLGGMSVAGGKLKEVGTQHWAAPNTGANNISGFTALPSGMYSTGGYVFDGTYGLFWTSDNYPGYNAYRRRLSYLDEAIFNDISVQQLGFSIRCIRD